MTPSHAYSGPETSGNWLTRTEAWLDARGKGAWIATMVLGFIFFWPVGLALLAYMIWSKRMFSGRNSPMSCSPRARGAMTRMRSSGNMAFDSYKADMLRRLEEEQEAFQSYLNRLREAKDKAEFDQFMDERAKRKPDTDSPVET
ncbi:DUF2852 domain-containing protein [Jannaschia sp. 2305UL9-9]|uniref:DUF2852 domain-containing protein n=1 Tax=Jannaschia sp. 2305UL9-9 TaxID=3121638 RepID=UPI0035275E96